MILGLPLVLMKMVFDNSILGVRCYANEHTVIYQLYKSRQSSLIQDFLQWPIDALLRCPNFTTNVG